MLVTIIDVGYALWFIFPAYCANAVPVIFGGGRPVDFGKIFLTENRYLDHIKPFEVFSLVFLWERWLVSFKPLSFNMFFFNMTLSFDTMCCLDL